MRRKFTNEENDDDYDEEEEEEEVGEDPENFEFSVSFIRWYAAICYRIYYYTTTPRHLFSLAAAE